MDLFEAVADPVRRDLLTQLSRSTATAGTLAANQRVSRPAVSRHLRVLREADLVRVTQHGRERVYEINTAPMRAVCAWIESLTGDHERLAPISSTQLDALELEVRRTVRTRERSHARTRAQPGTKAEIARRARASGDIREDSA
ncbi:hypothetical protein GCM10027416_29870 [Okibacterium endophyticum]